VAIPEDEVAQVRAATDLVALVGEHVALKRQGTRWVGLCPFHSERTPSFSLNAEEGLYYCFGCQASGDAISFVRAVEHLDFVGAVERLAERAGIALHKDDPDAGRRRDRRRLALDALEAAVDWYHQRLLRHPDAGPAREYLRSRGYDGDTVRAFRLGWAPEGWDTLARALRLPDRVLADSGLGFQNRAGRQQDAFRARVIFPIFDTGGRAVALGGRLLPGASDGPKYKNSPETVVYSKRRVLYGLNWAKASVVETGEVVVCEGYTDVIALWRAGIKRGVATCGTALAEDHLRILESFARRVVLAYDADAAGQAAAARIHEWESRHDLDIRVAALPAGSDPDEVGRDDPAALRSAVERARPFLEFRVDRVLQGADLSTLEGRARAAEKAVQVVSAHPDDLVRDQYVMAIADRCRLDAARLRERARTPARGRAAPKGSEHAAGGATPAGRAGDEPGKEPAGRAAASWRVEREALRLLAQRRDEVTGLMGESLFENPLHKAAFRALESWPTAREAAEASEPEVAALLRRLSVEEDEADPLEVASQLACAAGSRALAELDREARSSPGRALELMEVAGWLRLTVEELRTGTGGIPSLEALLAWLSERAKEDA
jgi:DNA primase